MAPRADEPQRPAEGLNKAGNAKPQAGPLVPFYDVPGMFRGIQALRRGDMILYTIRGEPEAVIELMAQLDKKGVSEVVALISHQADVAEALPPEHDVEADVQAQDG